MKIPKHLKAGTKRWVRAVSAGYDLEEHHERLLLSAAEAWDRAELAAAAIRDYGLTYLDKNGCPRSRPEVRVEKDGRLLYARMIRELGLDVASPADGNRPPVTTGRGRR